MRDTTLTLAEIGISPKFGDLRSPDPQADVEYAQATRGRGIAAIVAGAGGARAGPACSRR